MRISYSRCSTYQHCPQQYKLQYIDRIPLPRAVELEFGSAVHAALKFMYDSRHVAVPSLDDVVNEFAKAWQEIPPDEDGEARRIHFEQGVLLLTRHYEKHAAREQGRFTAATEQFFNIPFDGEHTLTGRIDRVDILPDNEIEVIDYKTSRRMPPQPTMEKDAQLAIYRMAADVLYPGRKVTTTLLYVFHDYEMSTQQTPEFLAEKQDEIRDAIAGIEAGKFGPKIGPHCDWCGYQAHCHLFRAPEVPPDLRDVDMAALLVEYADLDAQSKQAEQRLGVLKQQIHDYLDRCKTERVASGGFVVERRTSQRVTSWDDARLRELLSPLGLWEKITQVSTTALRDLLKSRQLSREEKQQVESAATYSEIRVLRVKRPRDSEETDDE
ncbi:MAG: PD-(D/E)XK nuclease family protein [Armatimonadota bacterium]|jgi:RecB family exonuclease